MKIGLGGIALLAMFSSYACGSNAKGDDDPDDVDDAAPDPADPTPSLNFAPDLDSAQAEAWQSEYDMLETRDVVAAIALPAAGTTQLLEIEILQPSGTIYTTIWRGVSTDPNAPPTMPHPTLDEEIAVERVSEEAGLATVFIGIPVAGTQITRFQITGTFSVEVGVEGQDDAEPLASSSFDIILSM